MRTRILKNKLSIYLDDETTNLLKYMAKKEERTISELVRKIVKKQLKK